MKITQIATYPVRIPLRAEYSMVSALGVHTSEYLLVRVACDSGLEGVGEATVTPAWSGETAWGAKAVIDQIMAPALIGADPFDLSWIDATMDRLAQGNWFAKSALEMAMWDLQGKSTARPVYELLGGAVRDRHIECRFSMGAFGPDRAAERAAELVEIGFKTIKIKVGTGVRDDIQRVRAVRGSVGDACHLVIDANGGWNAETAIDVIRQLADCNIGLVEQPTPRHDVAALAQVRAATGLPILADDIVFGLHDARQCLDAQACDAISVYPGKNGGMVKAQAIAHLAAQYGIPCTIGSNLEWDVASAAMCHLVVATPNIQVEQIPGDLLGPTYHQHSIAQRGLQYQGPVVRCPDSPGLGIDIDWNAVSRYASSLDQDAPA